MQPSTVALILSCDMIFLVDNKIFIYETISMKFKWTKDVFHGIIFPKIKSSFFSFWEKHVHCYGKNKCLGSCLPD